MRNPWTNTLRATRFVLEIILDGTCLETTGAFENFEIRHLND